MTLTQVRQLQAAEKAAKDAYYASAKAGTKADKTLYNAMVAATKARQAAMNAYAHSVYIKNNGWEL
jgi:L-amino acid N-acyltransferase YncA